MALQASIAATITANQTFALDSISTTKDSVSFPITRTYTDGVMWHDTRTLAAGTSETLDLASGVLDKFNNAVYFSRINVIAIKNRESVSNRNLQVGGAASNQFYGFLSDPADKLNLPNGASVLFENPNGYDVVVGDDETSNDSIANDQLKITNDSAGSITYDILIIGTMTD